MHRVLIPLLMAFLVALPAFAEDVDLRPAPSVAAAAKKPSFFDRHPKLFKATFPLRQPLKAAYNCTFPFRHPLETGKWCEGSGFNGLLGAMGGLGSVATPFMVSTFR